MKTQNKLGLLGGCLLSIGLVAGCGSDNDDGGDDDGMMSGDGVSSSSGDGDATGEMTGDGDGTSDSGSGDGDATSGDGDSSSSGGGAGGSPGEDECSTILELAAATADLSSLVAAVEAAGLGEALDAEGLTVFAPTNAAFESLLDGLGLEFSALTAEQLTPILTYHVAGAVADSEAAMGLAMSDDGSLSTLGGTIQFSLDGDALMIDADEAGAQVVMADVEACNGRVHVIDQVLLPSITDVVASHAEFSGLFGVIGGSETDPVDVAAALDGPASQGAWTLFAPNNDAVTSAPAGLSAEQLTTVLLYHAYDAAEAVPASVAVTLDTDIETAGGEDLTIDGDTEAGTVTLVDGADNEVSVVGTDIYAANGIIHVIDGVLIPPSLAP